MKNSATFMRVMRQFTSLFAALDVASGVTISNCYRRHRHQEFLRFLNDIDANPPRGLAKICSFEGSPSTFATASNQSTCAS